MKKTKKKINFIDNKAFFEEIVKYQDSVLKARNEGKDDPIVPDVIGKAIMLLCTRLGDRPNFINYSYKDLMISDAVLACLVALQKFDRNRTENPFAFFTQVSWYAFINRISIEKAEQYVKHKNYEVTYSQEFLNSRVNEDSLDPTTHYRIIDDFEEKKLKKQAKKEENKNE